MILSEFDNAPFLDLNPRLDLPLNSDLEREIEITGPRQYLMGMMRTMGFSLSPPIETLSDAECHKYCRAIFRGSSDYDGKELCQ